MKISKSMKFLICFAVIGPLLSSLNAFERRRDPFPSEPAHIILPLPYSIPGVGRGIATTGAMVNIWGSYTDIYIDSMNGDVEGYGGGILDFHLISKTLIFDFNRQQTSKLSAKSYKKRGMDTEKDEFNYVTLGNISSGYDSLRLTFWDRRLEFFFHQENQTFELEEVRDNEGELIREIKDPETISSKEQSYGVLIDITDDYLDPRKGFRLDVRSFNIPRDSDDDPKFDIININATLFLPIGKSNTWLFNYFTSDAYVESEGETNESKIKERIGLQCDEILDSSTRQNCQVAEQELIANTLAFNKNGISTPLGGRNRLRSYPERRFKGAHTRFFGSEFRWNYSEEVTPFDFLFFKDIRTSLQLALFAETGSIAENKEDLDKYSRSSYGFGLRMVSAAGLVYRWDWATGDEGSETVIFINYPWN